MTPRGVCFSRATPFVKRRESHVQPASHSPSPFTAKLSQLNRPLSALISNLGSFPWGSPGTLMLTDVCMIREGSRVRLQGTLPSDYQLEPPVRLAAPGPGLRLRHSLYEASHNLLS